MDSPDAPPAPDYRAAAEQTAAGNLQLARYTTNANRIDQNTPWGSQTYTNNTVFDQGAYDRAIEDWKASGSKPDKMPGRNDFYVDNWTQNTTLTPAAQQALNDQFAIQAGRSDTARSLLDNVETAYSQDFDPARLSDYLGTVGRLDQSTLGRADAYNTTARINTLLGNTGTVDRTANERNGDFSTGSRVNTDVAGALRGNQALNQTFGDFASGSRVNTDVAGAVAGARDLNQSFGRFGDSGSRVDTSAPEYNAARQQQYAKAAYESQMGLLRGDLQADETALRNQLAIQGLGAGTEANVSSMNQFSDAKSRQLNALLNQSVLTGNQMSNADYQSELAGFNAGNAAEAQRFGQNQSAFTTNLGAMNAENAARSTMFNQGLAQFAAGNAAQGQRFGQDLQRFNANQQSMLNENAARGQDFDQRLAAFNAGNDAQGQRYTQDQGTFNTNMTANMNNAQLRAMDNAAQQQYYDQILGRFNATNAANLQQAGLDQQAYNNSLSRLTTNAGLREQEARTQQQAYAQALQNYATQWQQDQTLRNMPLNELNALLTGQQVQNPQFSNFAMQNQTQGADYLGAMGQRAAWDQGIFNSQAASAGATNSTLGSLAGMAAMFMMSDKRLKKNLEKVGETEGGTNVYQWDWNAKGKELAGDAPTFGVLAQENPHAARKTSSGFLAVDYSKIH